MCSLDKSIGVSDESQHAHHAHGKGCGRSHQHKHACCSESIGTLPMDIEPIGFIHSSIAEPHFFKEGENRGLTNEPHTHPPHKKIIAEITIDTRWEDLLEGIEGYSHIMVLYWPHLLTPEQRNIRSVHPMGRKDIPAQGIFATRSPARPNPVLATVARLLERRGNVLVVQGLESVDGSPVIDIKPHTSGFYAAKDTVVVPAWMEQLQKEYDEKYEYG